MLNLSDIISKLRDTEAVFDEGTGNFQRISVDNAKKNLELHNRSKENGEAGIPLVESANKDSMAVEIDSYITEIVTIAKDKLFDRLHAIEELSQNQFIDIRKDISAIYESARNDLFTTAKDYYNDLFNLRRQWITGEDEYKEFRKTHNRIGPARHPEKGEFFNSLIIIGLFFGLEIGMNAYALGSSHPDGPIGVMLEIILFGIINLGTSMILGYYVWGYFKHVKLVWRAVATILALPMLGFITVLNGFIGHYRDALAKLSVNPELSLPDLLREQIQLAAIAVRSLLEHPLMLDDFKSYMISGVGLIAAIVALIKSYGLDEPYPGYGKLSRAQSLLASRFNDTQTAYLTKINDITDDYVDQLNDQISLLEGNAAALQYRNEDQKRLLDKYSNWLVSAESAGQALYAYYREENMKSRADRTEPRSFVDHQFSIPETIKNIPEVSQIGIIDTESIKANASLMAEKLNSDLRYYQDRFKDLTNLSPDQVIQEGFSDSDFQRPE